MFKLTLTKPRDVLEMQMVCTGLLFIEDAVEGLCTSTHNCIFLSFILWQVKILLSSLCLKTIAYHFGKVCNIL